MPENTPGSRTAAELMAAGIIPQLPTLLDTKQKEEWAANGLVFTITAIAIGTDQSGPYYSYSVTRDGEQYSFRLNAHPARDGLVNAILPLLEDGPIDGFVLTARGGKQGNAFLLVVPAV